MAKAKEIKVKERIGHTKEIPEDERVAIIEESSRTVGRSVFFSVIIMIISFAPILFLKGQEKKLFFTAGAHQNILINRSGYPCNNRCSYAYKDLYEMQIGSRKQEPGI